MNNTATKTAGEHYADHFTNRHGAKAIERLKDSISFYKEEAQRTSDPSYARSCRKLIRDMQQGVRLLKS